MKLTNLVSILKSGNIALGQKLSNLLTEDCTILEYTDDAVLFTKNGKLVIAKFNHNLAESKLSAADVLDNEVIYISGKETESSLKQSLLAVIDSLVEENYVTAEENLTVFTETYFQHFALKSRYPELFTENLKKVSKGFKLRKSVLGDIPEFKSEVFSTVALRESKEELINYVSVLESVGQVLVLGKTKVLELVTDAVLGNEQLAETVTDKLFEAALELPEANNTLHSALSSGYQLVEGKYGDEEVDAFMGDEGSEDIEEDFPTDDFDEGPKEFVDFDPSKLSDEELKGLHKTVLTSILHDMSDFVSAKANDEVESDIPADLDNTLKTDLEILSSDDLSDEELSKIEGRWQPVLSYFLDSEMYVPEQELEQETDISDVVTGGEDEETAETPEESEEEVPAEETLGEAMPEENPEETGGTPLPKK